MSLDVISLLLLIGALVCFVLDAFVVTQTRVSLLALGLALWVLVPLIHTANAIG